MRGERFNRRGRYVPQDGNMPHVKTDRVAMQVERMVFSGLDVSEISYCLGLSVVTLQSQYKDELDNGSAALIAKIGGAQIKAAMRGDSNAAQFLLRARARWVTPTKQEIDANVTIRDKRELMDEVLGLFHAARAKLVPQPAKQLTQLIEAKPQGKPS